jgi:hypothetical protein
MKRTLGFLSLFLSFLLLSTTAMALPTSPLWTHDSSGNLATYDIATDTVTLIGNMGAVMTDIAFDSSGNLFGLTFTGFYSIDSTNGNSTLIGSHGIAAGNALVFGTDGTLYGAGNSTTNLFSINTSTGAGSVLGDIGYSSSGDLAFNSSSFFLSADTGSNDTLVTIDQTSFAGSAVGNFGFDSVFGLATGDDGSLYGLSGTNVLDVNITTGAGTIISNFGGQGVGASFGSSFKTEAKPVPEPATILLFCSGLLGVAGIKRRRT